MAAPRVAHLNALRHVSRRSFPNHQIVTSRISQPALLSTHNEAPSRRTTQTPHIFTPTRDFTATATRKAVGDDSTIDFAYLPSADYDPPQPEIYRVPILHDNYTSAFDGQKRGVEVEDEMLLMKPEINTVSADSVILPMSDMSDGHSMNIDFHAMADRVAANLRGMRNAPAEEQASIMKQIWNDMVDDMLGSKVKRIK